MRHPNLRTWHGKSAGFTLVEVSIAVAILAVALVALLGLMPAGMTNFRKAMDTSVTAQIAQRILLDMQQADFDQVVDMPDSGTDNVPVEYTFTAPKRNSQQFRFFDDQGVELITTNGTNSGLSTPQKTAMVYQVNIRIMPTASEPVNGEKIKGAVALVTVQVARNPSNRTLKILHGQDSQSSVPSRNLYDPSAKENQGIQIFTYSALIGKNQG